MIYFIETRIEWFAHNYTNLPKHSKGSYSGVISTMKCELESISGLKLIMKGKKNRDQLTTFITEFEQHVQVLNEKQVLLSWYK